MSLDADGLLRAVESHPASIREGADSLVVLYCWRRAGGDPAGFMVAVETLVGQRLVEILPGPDLRLRLTAEGFQRLDAELPDAGEPAPAPTSEDEHVWQGGAARAPRETPPAEVVDSLLRLFAVLRLPADHPIGAGSLAKIWAMERRRGGDLRIALDILAATGELRIQRGDRTQFTLTETGVARLRDLAI
ncbi:MAG: hypothetical protein Q8Q73_08655 [Stagnimonas sp.]|nr:hypothetical protein [Stagnimonas sp.]